MNFLQNILNNSQLPLFTAFILGLLTAISPCPLATNITAVGFISKDISSRQRVFWNGLFYTLGRVIAYSVLGAVLIIVIRQGAETFQIQKAISHWSEMLIAPALILIGVFMIFGNRIPLPQFSFTSGRKTERMRGLWGSLLLGILFAMAFCPTSAMFYFGMLIPMSATESGGYLLPIVFAIATGLPVIIVAWIIAFSVSGIGEFYNSVKTFQKWFNIIVAVAFILVGVYYGTIYLGLI